MHRGGEFDKEPDSCKEQQHRRRLTFSHREASCLNGICDGLRLTDVQPVHRIRTSRLDTAFTMGGCVTVQMLNKTILGLDTPLFGHQRQGVSLCSDLLGSHFSPLRRERPNVCLGDAFFTVTHARQLLCLSPPGLRKGSSRMTGSYPRTPAALGSACLLLSLDLLWGSSVFNWTPFSMDPVEPGGGGWGATWRSGCPKLQ